MPRPARVSSFLSLAAVLAVTSPGFAQTPPAATPATPAAAPESSAPRPKRERAISSELAASLAASMPKYNPPPKPKPEEADVDLREVDKPRNGIIRLPKYTVREARPPVFRERDIYTRGGLADLARRRYLTSTYRLMNSFYIPLFTASPTEHAMAMYAEDERLANMAELNDTADTVSRANPGEGVYIKRATNETYMRTDSRYGYEKEP